MANLAILASALSMAVLAYGTATLASGTCGTEGRTFTVGQRFLRCTTETCTGSCTNGGPGNHPHPDCAKIDGGGRRYEFCGCAANNNCDEPACCHVIQYYTPNPAPGPQRPKWNEIKAVGKCKNPANPSCPSGSPCFLWRRNVTIEGETVSVTSAVCLEL